MDLDQHESAETDRRIYRFSKYELDLYEGSLKLGGERLSLPPRTIQVLQLLIERRGEIVAKEDFFDKVWKGSFVEDNNLTVAVTQIRKVLGDSAKKAEFIETVPRKGYRFIAAVDTVSRNAPEDLPDETPPSGLFPGSPYRRPLTRRVMAAGITAVLLVILAIAGFGYKTFWQAGVRSVRPIDSLAILPFADTSSEDEYLAYGMTESIIAHVSRLTHLRIIDRNSAFKFKNEPFDIARVSRELNVRAIVTGHVERQGDLVVVNVAMFDAESSSEVWHQQFSRRSDDLFAIEQEVSEAIAGVALSGSAGMEQRKLVKRPTNDPGAYELYLKGRYYWNKRQNPDILRSVDLFRAAIDRDPTFAMAYIGLANAYTLGDFTYIGISDEERIALSRGAVQKALEIDDTIGEAYASLAINKCYHDWDFAGADSDYRKAIELSPNDATAHHWYAEFLSMQGRFDESYAEYDKALSLDPLSLPIRADMAFAHYYARDYDKAIELLSLARQIDPQYPRTYVFFMFTFREKGMLQDAVDAYEQGIRLNYGPNDQNGNVYNNIIRHIAAIRKEGQDLTAKSYWQAELNYQDDPTPFLKAVIHSKLGNADKAFEYLARSLNERYSGMVWLKVTPELDGIRSDPRFGHLMKRVGF